MIKEISGLPAGVIGFELSGTVTAKDYESVLMPAVDAASSGGRKLRLLYQIGPDFEKYDLVALWDDARIGLKHLASWQKIALVTDVDWIRSAVSVFSFALPGRVRTFAVAQLADAKNWLAQAE